MNPVKRALRGALSFRRVALIALGMAIATFGLFNIHRRVDITEGGVWSVMPRPSSPARAAAAAPPGWLSSWRIAAIGVFIW